MDRKVLGPFRLAPWFSERPWGRLDLRPWYEASGTTERVGEAWLTGTQCVVETGALKGRTLAQAAAEEGARLRNFIRRRVPDPSDAEDIAQEVFYELVEANHLLMPIEHVTGWLYRVARNRITDLFRKKKPESFSDATVQDEAGELLQLEDMLPSPDA